mmetsp:Transcript_75439/g.208171  ORF Transcript_75439/g.208171 Transcript_75439/m.208171 type:complete len:316 (-) Transcript_75439:920-1867(-)
MPWPLGGVASNRHRARHGEFSPRVALVDGHGGPQFQSPRAGACKPPCCACRPMATNTRAEPAATTNVPPSPEARYDGIRDRVLVADPILAVLNGAALLVAPATVAIHDPEVDAIGDGQPWEGRGWVKARHCPADAHDQVTNVVEVARQAPEAGYEQERTLLSLDVLHLLVAEEDAGAQGRAVLFWVTAVVHEIAEQVLLEVGDAEEDHAEDVERHADGHEDVVLRDEAGGAAALLCQEAHEGDGVVAAQEAPVAVREHEAKEVVADVGGCQVCWLDEVVVKDVVPMREGDEDSDGSDVGEGPGLVTEPGGVDARV